MNTDKYYYQECIYLLKLSKIDSYKYIYLPRVLA